MANCGFGILAAGQPLKDAIIFWIGCGVLAALYFSAYIILALVRRRTGKHGEVAYTPATPGPYELHTYEGSQVNLINQPGRSEAPIYYPPPSSSGIPGRYEPDRYDERFQDRGSPEPYDPPRRQLDDPIQRQGSPVPRYGSPSGSRHNLHLG